MRKHLKALPEVLQRQFWFRILPGVLFLGLFIFAWIMVGELYACVTLIVISLMMLISGGMLLYNCSRGRYLCVIGECTGADYSRVLRRLKHIYIEAEGKTIKLPMRKLKGKLSEGDTVTVYISVNAPVIPCSDGYLINQYYAIEIGGR